MGRASLCLPLVVLSALVPAGCGKIAPAGAFGRVSFSATAAPHSGALSTVAPICARFTLQPFSLDAAGKVTLAGQPATFTSRATPGPPLAILGCQDDPYVAGHDWGYFVTADQFNDCSIAPVGGNPIEGISPSVVSKSYPLDCRAGEDISLDVGVDIYLVQPGPDGYSDLNLGVDFAHQLVGCKNAEWVNGALRFGEVGGFLAAGGPAPLGFTGIGLSASLGAQLPLDQPPSQFAGVIQTGPGTMGAYYTGVLPFTQSGYLTVLQGFAEACAPGEYYSRTQAPECETQSGPSGAPDLVTYARLADVFVVVPGQLWVSASLSGGLIQLTSGSGAALSNPQGGGHPAWNASTRRERLRTAYPVVGLYADRQQPGSLLLVSSTPLGPLLQGLSLDAASGHWQLGAAAPVASLSIDQLAARGVFVRLPGGCSRLP